VPIALYLVSGDLALSLRRPVTLGRLESCDLPLEGLEVSRRHARILPTPEGPVLVDRSRYGTILNDAVVAAPALLADGDRLRVGRHDLLITAVPWEHGAVPLPESSAERFLPRFSAWRRRYGVPELAGLAAAMLAGLGVQRLTGSVLVTAGAATLAETACFYSLLARQDLVAERQAEAGTAPPLRVGALLRQLHVEFGAADVADTLVLRPACYALGLWLFGGIVGLLVGAAGADLLFWGPVLGTFHWRLAARPGTTLGREHRRATTQTTRPPLPEG